MMTTIEYDTIDGQMIADGNAEDFALSLLSSGSSYAKVSTANVIHAARALAVEHNFQVEFIFEGKTITPNEYGAILDWPKGFCDKTLNWTSRVLTFAVRKRKEENEKKVLDIKK